MFVPLAHLRHFGDAEIVLNNNGIDPLVVRPVWFVRGSRPVRGREVTMPPLTMEFKQIPELLPDHIPASRVDGLLIEYVGKLLELGGQVVLRDDSGQAGHTLDVHFSMAMDFRSSRREATWMSTRGEAAILVIANTARNVSHVEIASSYGSRRVTLNPYQARMVRLETSAATRRDGEKRAMWAVVDSNGDAGDLRVTGFVATESGAPRLIRFYDPGAVKQPHLYATRMRVANARGDLTLKNTSALPVVAQTAFLDGDSGQPLFDLAPVTLGPHAAQAFDLQPAMAALAASTAAEAVAVRVESDGPAGVLIGSLYVQDLTTGLLLDVPRRRPDCAGRQWRPQSP